MSTVDRGMHRDRDLSEDNSSSVQCIPLLDLMQETQVEGPVFIKVDTEGFEAEIVASWREWIPLWRPKLFVSMHQHLRTFTPQEKAALADTLALFPLCIQVDDADPTNLFRAVNATSETLCIKCDYFCSFKD